ncbi:MAG: helix-turn-helix domain-containing protein, partial [bacterium]|nr:helix-turn-helix domain-containing protein [bacterium]
MARIDARNRPHYPPTERLAILALKAARCWSARQTASRMLLSPATIASWLQRLNEQGSEALVQEPAPVNRFPDFVTHTVQQLKALSPSMGKKRVAEVLARAGLHLGQSTVGRMLARPPLPQPGPTEPQAAPGSKQTVIARYPNHVWGVDLTMMPTSAGFWIPALPFSLPVRWPFCWWIAIVVDHFSRKVVGCA